MNESELHDLCPGQMFSAYTENSALMQNANWGMEFGVMDGSSLPVKDEQLMLMLL